jgi:hypothetical protein
MRRRGPDVLAPDDPRHGEPAGYKAGCTCDACYKANKAYEVQRSRLLACGQWRPWVDADEVRAHIRGLAQHNIGWKQVAHLAGLNESSLRQILHGRKGKPPVRRCHRKTAEAILSVRPTLDNLPDSSTVNSTGTVRRLRALVALGWPMHHLGNMLPSRSDHIHRLIRYPTPTVTVGLARAVRDLYEQLSMTVPPDTWMRRRTRAFAAQQGWVPPLAWDDADIDDPQATPQVGEPVDVDEVAVEQRLSGRRIHLTDRELTAAVALGFARGMSRTAIAEALHISHDRVCELAGLPTRAERRRRRSRTGTTCPSPDPARSDVAA